MDATAADALAAAQRGAESFQFTLSFHHVLLDGWSIAALLAEWFHHYWRLLGRESEVEAPLEWSYSQFLKLERAAIESEETQRYWREQIDNNQFTKYRAGARVRNMRRRTNSNSGSAHSLPASSRVSATVWPAVEEHSAGGAPACFVSAEWPAKRYQRRCGTGGPRNRVPSE